MNKLRGKVRFPFSRDISQKFYECRASLYDWRLRWRIGWDLCQPILTTLVKFVLVALPERWNNSRNLDAVNYFKGAFGIEPSKIDTQQVFARLIISWFSKKYIFANGCFRHVIEPIYTINKFFTLPIFFLPTYLLYLSFIIRKRYRVTMSFI